MRPEGFNYLPEAWRAYIAGLESVRSEALMKAAKICESFAPKIVETNSASELIASTAHQIREKILALSPARVAEPPVHFRWGPNGMLPDSDGGWIWDADEEYPAPPESEKDVDENELRK